MNAWEYFVKQFWLWRASVHFLRLSKVLVKSGEVDSSMSARGIALGNELVVAKDRVARLRAETVERAKSRE